MKLVELNPSGYFDPWEPSKIEELKNMNTNEPLGQHLLFENDTIKLWDISLEPKERLPFRIQKTDYSWICLTGGLAISRFSDGKICLIRVDQEETGYWEFKENQLVCDLENVGDEVIKINIMEHKPVKENIQIQNTNK
ncbi:MAG: hypothetical protein COA50_06775 [Flavobacteriaceae bacterium]|nr:MAG: hypothetical protein COA50_06775 [Flavobacteriaceae bacterium]